MSVKRHINPFTDTKPTSDKQLPFIRGSRVLLQDPALIARLQHISRPFRGGEALDRQNTPEPNEPTYVDMEMMIMVLLNEVAHLREQIGLVCCAAHQATGGQFRVNPKPPFRSPTALIKDRRPVIEDYIVLK